MKFKDYVLWILVMAALFIGIYNSISIMDMNSTLEWQAKINDVILMTQGVILEILDALTENANELIYKLPNLNDLLII